MIRAPELIQRRRNGAELRAEELAEPVLAYSRGCVHEGEFADVGATVNAWVGGKRRGAVCRGRRL